MKQPVLPSMRHAAAFAALALAASAGHAQSGSVTWGGWSLSYAVNSNAEGLVLSGVKFNNRSVLRKISLPVMRVFYDGNGCGPYADRIGPSSITPVTWANNAQVVLREFTLNGQQWNEIGVRAQIGNYDIYQAYYLGADGTLDAHIYSKGLQCRYNHVHYPNWRIDVDLDGAANNVIERVAGTGYEALGAEFNAAATSASNHQWRVRNSVTGMSLDVLPGFADFTIADGNRNVPVTAYDRNTVFGRAYRASEDIGWTVGPNTQVPYGNGESIAADAVLWYEGYMPHAAADGQSLWHSTGLRLVTRLDGAPPPPPPPTGSGNLIVRAKATTLDGIGADMEVFVNGRSLGTTTVNAVNDQDYGFDVPALQPGDRVDVVFRNDAYDAATGADRNLFITHVLVNNQTMLLPNADGYTYDKGDGAAAFDGVNVVPGTSGLWENGALRMAVPGVVPPPPPPAPTTYVDTGSNGSRSSAQAVARPAIITGSISWLDNDYFRFSVPAGTTIAVAMTGTGDMDMQLVNGSGSVLASGNASSGANESFGWTNRSGSAQTVYLRVYGYYGATGTYRVTLD